MFDFKFLRLKLDDMNDKLVKILSIVFNKNALAGLVVILGGLLIHRGYKDFTEGQNSIRIDINKVIDNQLEFKGETRRNFNTLYLGQEELKQGQAVLNLKVDILKRSQSKPTQQEIENVDELVEHLPVHIPERSFIPDTFIYSKGVSLTSESPDIKLAPQDTVKKKLFFNA